MTVLLLLVAFGLLFFVWRGAHRERVLAAQQIYAECVLRASARQAEECVEETPEIEALFRELEAERGAS
jgi:hypothetical protein